MKTNKNTIIKKGLLIATFLVMSNIFLVADSVENSPSIPYVEYKNINAHTRTISWESKSNNCTQTYTFSAFSNMFRVAAHTGKNILGVYSLEEVKNSKRIKLTLYPLGDNQLNDCFSSLNYDSVGKVIVFYLYNNPKNGMLQFSESKTGKFFGFYSQSPYLFDKKSDLLIFNNVYRLLKVFSLKQKLKAYAKQQEKIPKNNGKDYTNDLLNYKWKMMDEQTEAYKAEQIQDRYDTEFYDQQRRDEDYYNN